MNVTIQQSRWPLGRSRAAAILFCASAVLLVAGVAIGVGLAKAWSVEPEVVARVNGDPVTRGEVQRLLADPHTRRELQQKLGVEQKDDKELGRLVVQKLIVRHLFLQEAARRNLTVPEQAADQSATALRSHFPEPEKFQAWLRSRGLDEKSLRETIHADMLVSRITTALVEGVNVTEAQVQEYYGTHKADLRTPDQVRLRIIAVNDKAAAEEIVAAVRKGEDFDRLARERSQGFRAARGGDMGWIALQTLTPALREVVGALKVGETSAPVQEGDRFLIVRVVERRPEHALSFDEARPQIERGLRAGKQQAVLKAWLKEQGKAAKIEVLR